MMYFCPSTSFSVESAVAVLMTATESERCLLGPLLAGGHMELLTTLVQEAFTLASIQVSRRAARPPRASFASDACRFAVQVTLQVLQCLLPPATLRLYRGQAPSPSASSMTLAEVGAAAQVELPPHRLWTALFWAEWLQVDALRRACRREIVQILLPSAAHLASNEAAARLLFAPWLGVCVSAADGDALCAQLVRHFLAFGPAARDPATPADTAPPKPPAHEPRALSVDDLSVARRAADDHVAPPPLRSPPLQPPAPPQALAPATDGRRSSGGGGGAPKKPPQRGSPASVAAIASDDDATVDSWATLRRDPPRAPPPVKATPLPAVDATPQHSRRVPQPMPPLAAHPAAATVATPPAPSSSSRRARSPSPAPRAAAAAVAASTAADAATTATPASDVRTSVNLELAREVALLRLRHARIQRELETSKAQAAQALRATHAASRVLQTKTQRVASRSPGNAASPAAASSSQRSATPRKGAASPAEDAAYAQARREEQQRQDALNELARQRAAQRIHAKKLADERQRWYDERQRQYQRSLQRQQRLQTVAALWQKTAASDAGAAAFDAASMRSGRAASRSASPATRRSSERRQVTFAVDDAPLAAAATTTATAAKRRGPVAEAAAATVDELPPHPAAHHRYSLAALRAVAQGASPSRALTPPPAAGPRVVARAQIRSGGGGSGEAVETAALQWPSPAQLQTIKERQLQLRRQLPPPPPPPERRGRDETRAALGDPRRSGSADDILRTRPPTRDVSPPAATGRSRSGSRGGVGSLSLGSGASVAGSAARVGGKHSPPRSFADVEAALADGGDDRLAAQTSQRLRRHTQQLQQLIRPDAAGADATTAGTDVAADDDAAGAAPSCVMEVSVGLVTGLSDARCLGALQHVYLLLKYLPGRARRPAAVDALFLEPFRSPTVKCEPATAAGGGSDWYAADFRGACLHLPVDDAAAPTQSPADDGKVVVEVYAQQASVADECIARCEAAVSQLLWPFHQFPAPSGDGGGVSSEAPPQVWWQKLALETPGSSGRSAPAGEMEVAVQMIPLYV